MAAIVHSLHFSRMAEEFPVLAEALSTETFLAPGHFALIYAGWTSFPLYIEFEAPRRTGMLTTISTSETLLADMDFAVPYACLGRKIPYAGEIFEKCLRISL